MSELLRLLCEYFRNANEGMSWLEIVVEYAIPIIGTIMLVGSAVAGVVKYWYEKNKNFYERILVEVYAPLYQYIIKQEFFRKDVLDLPLEKYPIISLTHTKTKETISFTTGETKREEEKSQIIDSKELFKVTKSLNFGLVPEDLLILLCEYEMLYKLKRSSQAPESIAILMALRKNVIEGYHKYYQKLGVSGKSKLITYDENTGEILFVEQ